MHRKTEFLIYYLLSLAIAAVSFVYEFGCGFGGSTSVDCRFVFLTLPMKPVYYILDALGLNSSHGWSLLIAFLILAPFPYLALIILTKKLSSLLSAYKRAS